MCSASNMRLIQIFNDDDDDDADDDDLKLPLAI